MTTVLTRDELRSKISMCLASKKALAEFGERFLAKLVHFALKHYASQATGIKTEWKDARISSWFSLTARANDFSLAYTTTSGTYPIWPLQQDKWTELDLALLDLKHLLDFNFLLSRRAKGLDEQVLHQTLVTHRVLEELKAYYNRSLVWKSGSIGICELTIEFVEQLPFRPSKLMTKSGMILMPGKTAGTKDPFQPDSQTWDNAQRVYFLETVLTMLANHTL